MLHFYFTHSARGQKTYGFLHTSHSNSTFQLHQNVLRKAQNNEKWLFLIHNIEDQTAAFYNSANLNLHFTHDNHP